MKSFFNYSRNRILYSLLRLALFIAIGFLIGNLKVNAATYEYQIFGGVNDSEFGIEANSSRISTEDKFIFFGKTMNNYMYVDVCTTGNKPSTWVYDVKAGSASISTQVLKVNKRCVVSGYNADVYRFTFFIASASDIGQDRLGLTFTTRLFNETSYYTYMRILSVFGSDTLSYADIEAGQSESIQQQQKEAIEATKKIQEEQKKTNEKLDQAENTRKGIWQTIKELPTKFLEMLKSLFIPEDMSFLDNLKESLEEKLGFIASIPIQVLDYIISLPNKVFTPITSVSFPSISIFGVNFWSSEEIDISEGLKWFQAIKYFSDILCVTLVVNTLVKWYKSFGGGA